MTIIDPALHELVDEQRQHNAVLMQTTAQMSQVDTTSTAGLAWLRQAMEPGGLFGFTESAGAENRTIPGPDGPMGIRVLRPDGEVDGVYLHLHGGGMTVGSAVSMDARNERWAKKCNVAVVSVDYRLAPEHPFPAGPDDCEAAALWLIDHAVDEFGTDRLLIGGESAGAYLGALTLIRLRDRLGGTPPFRGADLCYGVYDFSGTPSTKQYVGKVPYATGEGANTRYYLGERTVDERRDPAISPLWAELHDLPPILLTVGTADWLLDDSLFFAARLEAAGSPVELAVYPEGPHGIDSAPTAMGRAAAARIHEFLRRCLA